MNKPETITKDMAQYFVRRLKKPDQVEAALKKVEAASSFAIEHLDGGEDPDSDFLSVFADGEEIAVVWN